MICFVRGNIQYYTVVWVLKLSKIQYIIIPKPFKNQRIEIYSQDIIKIC